MGFPRRIALATLAVILAAPARAQDCGPLKILDIVHMIPSLTGNAEFIPVVIGGKPRNFLLDTGGYYSQISRPLAEALQLPIRQSRHDLYDVAGNVSRDQATVPQMTVGEITDNDVELMISASLGKRADEPDGVLAADRLVPYDAELDFSSDTLNLFSPDHCPGHVVYWTAPAVAEVPITLSQSGNLSAGLRAWRNPPDRQSGDHILVQVMLDGEKLNALLDTGAQETSLRMDLAEQLYHLTMGAPGTPLHGNLNGDAGLKTYSHLFQNLRFGAVTVSNAHIVIIPNAMGRFADRSPLVSDRTKSEKDLVNEPELILGMDVLRRLRLYLAFHEGKMYVSPATAAPDGGVVQPYSPAFLTAMLSRLDVEVATSPDDPATLNDRCFWRAIAKTALDGAIADCDKSLKIEPGSAATLDSRAFVLYQQGNYQGALAAYDAALKADSRLAPSLLMRGLAKGKLGDENGEKADIAAAKADDPNIEAEFHRIGIDE